MFVSDTPFRPTDTPATLQNRAGNIQQPSDQRLPIHPPAIAAGAQGRYVRVQLTGTNYLSLAEVQVFGTGGPAVSNLALGKPATQSSTLPGYATAGAASAVDGNTDGNFSDGSVTATNLDTNAWWQVDLGASAAVSSIVDLEPHGLLRLPAERLLGVCLRYAVRSGGHAGHAANSGRRDILTSDQRSQSIHHGCHDCVEFAGRYVRVQLTGTNYLSLAEVQVFGQ